MQRIGRVTLFSALVLMGGLDIWLAALRCASSPPIDWSRLAFGFTIQVGVLAGSGLLVHFEHDLSRASRWRFSIGLLVAAAFTFVLVRQPLLLSDTTYDKFYDSSSYRCPGVPQFWRPGP